MTEDPDYFMDETSMTAEELAAVEWHLQLLRGDAPETVKSEFEAWLSASPSNAAAYAALTRMWEKVETVADAELRRPSAKTAKRVEERGALAGGRRLPRSPWPVLGGGVVLALLAMLFVQLPSNAQSYRTAVGEQREVRLADGSTLMLNTGTSVEVQFRRNVRLVRLKDGQASFSVAHNENRPFVVFAESSAVLAVGTEFEVFRSLAGVRVTLIDGAVDVAAGLSEPGAIAAFAGKKRNVGLAIAELAPGDQVAIEAGSAAISPVAKVDVEQVMAWRAGKVSFRNTPLREAIAEMNRYGAVKIRLGEDELGDLPVSGAFGIESGENFISAVKTLFDLDSRKVGNQVVLMRRKAA